jgi:hypothetical protein
MKLVEGIDYYWENHRMIFTREFLLSRGFCCNSNCKHCPYKEIKKEQNEAEQDSD